MAGEYRAPFKDGSGRGGCRHDPAWEEGLGVAPPALNGHPQSGRSILSRTAEYQRRPP